MNSRSSPYAGKPESKWRQVTDKLLARHPLKANVILAVALEAWARLWETSVGASTTATRLAELDVPATVIGYFLEVLFAKSLEERFPGTWRGNRSKEEKDLVYVPDPSLSVEIKTSGQLGLRVYGNRSYGQQLRHEELAKKEKSGYYLTVNFFARALTLLRFGWIDAEDWRPQAAPTGQMAGLPDAVYQHKLRPITGDYQLQAPVGLLKGVGGKTIAQLAEYGIRSIRDLVDSGHALPARLERLRQEARRAYGIR